MKIVVVSLEIIALASWRITWCRTGLLLAEECCSR
jgi:hypothetical protein